MRRQIILLVNIQILILIGLRDQKVEILLLVLLGNECLVCFNKIFQETFASKPRVFIGEHVFDVGHLNLLLVLVASCVTNLRFDVNTIIIIHLFKANILLFHTFKHFLGVDYLNLSVFVNKKENTNIILFYLIILLPGKNCLFIILFSGFSSRLLVLKIGQAVILVSSCVWNVFEDIYIL